MHPFFFIFILVPILEMFLLFKVAEYIGALTTLALVVLTAIIGVQILRQQGLATLTRANQRLNSGELPAEEMLEGLLLAVGGAFLLTPGFLTDTLGFLLLIRPSRRFLLRRLFRSGRIAFFGMGRGSMGSGPYHHSSGREDGQDVYEGEFERETEKNPRLGDRDRF